jgi:hypothetical protein
LGAARKRGGLLSRGFHTFPGEEIYVERNSSKRTNRPQKSLTAKFHKRVEEATALLGSVELFILKLAAVAATVWLVFKLFWQ